MVARRKPSLPFDIERVKLNRQGYDSRGRYFGVGDPVYRLDHKETGEMRSVRAKSRADAIAAGVRLWGRSNPQFVNPSLQTRMKALTAALAKVSKRLGVSTRARKPAKKKRRKR